MIVVGPGQARYDVDVRNEEMVVYGGGMASNTSVWVGGTLSVSGGGIVSQTYVDDIARGMYIYNGGSAYYGTILNDVIVYSGGVAYYLNARANPAHITVSSGGFVCSNFVDSSAKLTVSSGGVASGTYVSSGGTVEILTGGRLPDRRR